MIYIASCTAAHNRNITSMLDFGKALREMKDDRAKPTILELRDIWEERSAIIEEGAKPGTIKRIDADRMADVCMRKMRLLDARRNV